MICTFCMRVTGHKMSFPSLTYILFTWITIPLAVIHTEYYIGYLAGVKSWTGRHDPNSGDYGLRLVSVPVHRSHPQALARLKLWQSQPGPTGENMSRDNTAKVTKTKTKPGQRIRYAVPSSEEQL